MSSPLGLIFGTDVLVVGVEEGADDEAGLLRVYIEARYLNRYVLLSDPADQERARDAWRGGGHVTMPRPPADLIYTAPDGAA